MNLPSGVAASVSRTVCAFLKVRMPVKLTSEFSASTRRICSGVPTKQWNTPRTRPANGWSIASVSSKHSPRVWMTRFKPTSAATSSCC